MGVKIVNARAVCGKDGYCGSSGRRSDNPNDSGISLGGEMGLEDEIIHRISKGFQRDGRSSERSLLRSPSGLI